MKKYIIWTLSIVAVLALAGAAVWFYWPVETINLEEYVPSEEFEPAYDALHTKRAEYDIEETVRAMNALEVAQCQSEDFMSYLEYVARQDFSRVAPEVLEQKKKLFPILQRLYELQKQHKELDDVWMLMRSATSGATTFANEVNPVGVIGSMMVGDATLSTFSVSGGFDKAKTAAFDEYEKQKELKRNLEREIESIRMSYIEYLEDYAPIYYKYMQEWDALCLKKDKAYIDLYGGRSLDAYNQADAILQDYPTNREALLLKSLSLINLAQTLPASSSPSSSASSGFPADSSSSPSSLASSDSPADSSSSPVQGGVSALPSSPEGVGESVSESLLLEAESTLDQYIKLYPSRSAPALVLKGLLYRSQNENAKAISYFDQASMEYPRQAADLTDLLDSYKARTYLNHSAEGKYLLRLYRSTMEGFGIFSPNLLKAKYYAQLGDTDQSKAEIFNHFFRRGNQGVYDCLLSDMQYCEENMYSSFKQILLEQSFIDVSVEPTMNWTLANKDDEIKVTINNRSDIDLENVRIFLCLHYTDMYKDEYDVQKLPSVNIIKHNDKTEIGVVKLNYEDKKYNDITRIRAIAMTDDKICWIDNVDYKYMRAAQSAARTSPAPVSGGASASSPSSSPAPVSGGASASPSSSPALVQGGASAPSLKQQLLKDFNVDGESLARIISSGIKIYASPSDGNLWNDVKSGVKNIVTGKDKKLRIELPRILTLIDPVFSLHQVNDKDKAIRPSENYLSGSSIRLKFDYEPKQNDLIPLYIYSDLANFKVTIQLEEGKTKIKNVELM
ncbi:MAG: hypothetical protein IJ635_01775 [Bacteroidaceae bacterium]|nr:hypothetical protein [Bacteroidaceae bacterium]